MSCWRPGGQSRFTQDLPAGRHYSQIRATPSGGCVVVGTEPSRNEVSCFCFDHSGTLVGTTPIGSATPVASCVINDKFVAYHGNGSVEITGLSGSGEKRGIPNVLRPVAITEGFVPTMLMVSMEPAGPNEVGILDHTMGRIALVDVSKGTVSYGKLQDPVVELALQKGREYIEAVRKFAASSSQPSRPAVPRVLHASTNDQRGNILCIPGPVNPSAPLLLHLSPAGNVLKRFRCALPDRSGKQDKVPFHMAYLSPFLLLAFLNGTGSLYRFEA